MSLYASEIQLGSYPSDDKYEKNYGKCAGCGATVPRGYREDGHSVEGCINALAERIKALEAAVARVEEGNRGK